MRRPNVAAHSRRGLQISIGDGTVVVRARSRGNRSVVRHEPSARPCVPESAPVAMGRGRRIAFESLGCSPRARSRPSRPVALDEPSAGPFGAGIVGIGITRHAS